MKRKILVVDDEHEYVALLSDILTTHGYGVISAYDGQQALEIISKDKPDLIILDVKMPNMNGWEVGKIINSDTRYSHIPFLMLTACGEFDDIKKGMELGAVSYISKPFKRDTLLALVEGLISKATSS